MEPLQRLQHDVCLNGTDAAPQVLSPNVFRIGTWVCIIAAAAVVHISLILKSSYSKKTYWSRYLSKIVNIENASLCVVLAILAISSPILISISSVAFIYKTICVQIIKKRDPQFAAMLDSFDVFWSLEDECSKSIIIVAGIIKSCSSEETLHAIRHRLSAIYEERRREKIFFTRAQYNGYFYWRRSKVNIEEYVTAIDNENGTPMDKLLTERSKTKLPYNDRGLFQILITTHPVRGCNEYGIIFKIHHSLGDGVALIEFLCKSLADESRTPLYRSKSFYKKDPLTIFEQLNRILRIPVCFAKGIIRKPDINSLHGATLTGSKVFAWTESKDLLNLMKDIKRNRDIRFLDLLATALSSGLKTYLEQKMTTLPKNVAAVLPVRWSVPEDSLNLTNDFTVTILDVPVRNSDILNLVRERYERLRKSSEALSNYCFLKLACSVFPRSMLSPMLDSRQATLVLSNVPGPDCLSVGGCALDHLVFFAPHKGYTGVCVSALTYGGVLRLAASVDTALISDADSLRAILEGMVAEIRRLHLSYRSQ